MENKKNKKWSKEEIDFLISSYEKYSASYCAKILKITTTQVQSKIFWLKRKNKIIGKRIYFDNVNINNYNSKIGAYILGYLWADGHVPLNNKRIVLKINKHDCNEIKQLFLENWVEYEFKSSPKTITLFNNSEKLYHFLKENDYCYKSTKSPDKILKFLREEYRQYFYLGIVDGDGSFYLNMKYGLRQFEVSSSYNQDWKYFEDLCLKLNIKYKISLISKINKKTKKENKSSSFKIIGKEILKLGEFLYQNKINTLERKYNKYQEIKKSYGNS